MEKKTALLDMTPNDFVNYLKTQNIKRFYFYFDFEQKQVRVSHPALNELADFLNGDKRDFAAHEGGFFQISPQTGILQGAFIHRTERGQAAGGVRFWQYESMQDYLRDGLRLAKGMTRKNALAGLWWGGGKGVMAHDPRRDKEDPEYRHMVYSDYGRLMTAIKGCYVTAEDVGTSVDDMAAIFSQTRFTTCIPETLGGSGNPSVPTARGVVCGMEAALDYLNLGTLQDKTVAVQGMGHVAEPLIGFLFEAGVKKVVAADIQSAVVHAVQKKYAEFNLDARLVKAGDNSILQEACDILAPCATGAVLNPQTIPNIKAKIICGAANNQLQDAERDGETLRQKGIVYVPDFLNNRMGIVNCADEQAGYIDEDPYFTRHLGRDWEHSIYNTTLRVLNQARQAGQSTAMVAMQLADQLAAQVNPIYGHRGKEIIRSLVREEWQNQSN